MTVTYMNGAGNDFMVIDARGQTLDFEALAKELCKLLQFSQISAFSFLFYVNTIEKLKKRNF